MNSAGPSEPSRTAEHEDQAALRLVAVALLVHMLRSRRFWERLAFSAVVVGALARIGEENGAGTLARLAAWNKRQAQRLEHKAERHAGRLQHQAE